MPPPAHPFNPEAQQTQLDLTQHSAAMLCDLQCQSSLWYNSLPSLQSTLRTWAWATMIFTLVHLNIMTTYKTTLQAFFSTLSPTTTARISTRLSTICSTLTPRLRLQQPTTSLPLLSSLITLLLLLTPTPASSTLQPSSISATLAQHLLLATGLPMMQGSSAQALPQSRTSGGSIVSSQDEEMLAREQRQKLGMSCLVAAQPRCSRRLDERDRFSSDSLKNLGRGGVGDGLGGRALDGSGHRDDSGLGSEMSTDCGRKVKHYDYVPKE